MNENKINEFVEGRIGAGKLPLGTTPGFISRSITGPIALTEALKRDLTHGRLTIEELPLLYAGDQMFIRTEIYGPPWEWWGAFLIRVGTFTGTDKAPTVVNHIATVIRPIRAFEGKITSVDLGAGIKAGPGRMEVGPTVDYLIAEALGRGGFQYNRLLESYGDARRYSIAIARHKLATHAHREKILAACEHLLGKSYGFVKIGAHGLDYGLTIAWNAIGGRGDVFAFRRLCRMERYPMCSWASLYEYRKAGLPFATRLEMGSPDDLWDECRRKALGIWLWPFCSRSLKSALFGPGFADGFQDLKRRRS